MLENVDREKGRWSEPIAREGRVGDRGPALRLSEVGE